MNERNFVDNLTGAARENPLGAALIAGGALWLLFGSGGIKSAASGVVGLAEPIVDTTARNLRQAGAAVREGIGSAAEMTAASANAAASRLREGMQSTANAASESVDSLREGWSKRQSDIAEASEQLPDMMAAGREGYAQTRNALADLLESQPLALGAIGLAIGGVVASAFAASATENEMAGPLSDRLKSNIKARAEDVSASLREGADTLKNEVSEMTDEAADKLRQTSADAVRAARERAGA